MPKDGVVSSRKVLGGVALSVKLYPLALIEELALEIVKIDRGWTPEAAREIAVAVLSIPGIGMAIQRAYIGGIGVMTRSADGYDSPPSESVRIHVAGAPR